MTARTASAAGLTIQSDPGESPTEVISSYIRELVAAGHEITGTHRCRNCHTEFRHYMPIVGSGVQIFSDFEDGVQCPHRQMNVHGGES
jgi:hypothetical protein